MEADNLDTFYKAMLMQPRVFSEARLDIERYIQRLCKKADDYSWTDGEIAALMQHARVGSSITLPRRGDGRALGTRGSVQQGKGREISDGMWQAMSTQERLRHKKAVLRQIHARMLRDGTLKEETESEIKQLEEEAAIAAAEGR